MGFLFGISAQRWNRRPTRCSKGNGVEVTAVSVPLSGWASADDKERHDRAPLADGSVGAAVTDDVRSRLAPDLRLYLLMICGSHGTVQLPLPVSVTCTVYFAVSTWVLLSTIVPARAPPFQLNW